MRFGLPVSEICKCERVTAHSWFGCKKKMKEDHEKMKYVKLLFLDRHELEPLTWMKNATKDELLYKLEGYAGISCEFFSPALSPNSVGILPVGAQH